MTHKPKVNVVNDLQQMKISIEKFDKEGKQYAMFNACGMQWYACITDKYDEEDFTRFILSDIKEAAGKALAELGSSNDA